MKSSKSAVMTALFCAVCVLGVLVVFALDPFELTGRTRTASPGADATLAALVRDMERRLGALEADVRRGPTRGETSSGEERSAGSEDSPEEEGALPGRVADLESRVRTIESHVRALSRDPVTRGFEYVASANEDLRRRGIQTLRRLARSDPQALAAIRNLLDDPDAGVREEALEALEDLDDRESIPRVVEMLGDAESRVRDEAIESLAEMLEDGDPNDPQVHQAALSIAERLADPDRDIRRQAANSLGDFAGQAAVPALMQALEDEDDGVRAQAIDSLADLQATSAVPSLRAMYEGDPGRRGMDIAIALRRLGDSAPFQKEVSRWSQVATSSADEQERRQAIRQLGRFEAAELRPLFEKALKDPSRRVRREAEEALEDLD